MKTHGKTRQTLEMPQNYSSSIKEEPNFYRMSTKINKQLTLTHHHALQKPTSPSSDVDHPHLIYYRPLSKSQPSIVTVPDSPTHLDKNIQTTPEENPYPFPPPTVTVQTLPSPSMTLQLREPPDLPTLLQLRDLLQDPKLYTPMIAHCNLHSPVLNLYKSYCHTMRLEEHHQFKRIKIPTWSGLVHALYQLNALPFLKSLKEAPQKHGRRIFCTSCYHLGHYKEDCPFY